MVGLFDIIGCVFFQLGVVPAPLRGDLSALVTRSPSAALPAAALVMQQAVLLPVIKRQRQQALTKA